MRSQFCRTLTLRGDVSQEYEETFTAVSANNTQALQRSEKALDYFAEYTNCNIYLAGVLHESPI
jgi:hypothetical protein